MRRGRHEKEGGIAGIPPPFLIPHQFTSVIQGVDIPSVSFVSGSLAGIPINVQ